MIEVYYQEKINVWAQIDGSDEELIRDYAKKNNCSLSEAVNELVAQNKIQPWDCTINEELDETSDMEVVEEN